MPRTIEPFRYETDHHVTREARPGRRQLKFKSSWLGSVLGVTITVLIYLQNIIDIMMQVYYYAKSWCTACGSTIPKLQNRQTPVYHQFFIEAMKLNPPLSNKEQRRVITTPAKNYLEDPNNPSDKKPELMLKVK